MSSNYLARAILTCDKPDSARVSTLANFRGKNRARNFHVEKLLVWRPKLSGLLFTVAVKLSDHFLRLQHKQIQSLNPFGESCRCFPVTNPHVSQFFLLCDRLDFTLDFSFLFFLS
jgi:hypothetical protein